MLLSFLALVDFSITQKSGTHRHNRISCTLTFSDESLPRLVLRFSARFTTALHRQMLVSVRHFRSDPKKRSNREAVAFVSHDPTLPDFIQAMWMLTLLLAVWYRKKKSWMASFFFSFPLKPIYSIKRAKRVFLLLAIPEHHRRNSRNNRAMESYVQLLNCAPHTTAPANDSRST